VTSGTGARRWAERILALERPFLLALDVDGTITPIAAVPGDARVSAATMRALERIAGSRDARLALVTGRTAGALSRIAPIDGAWRAVEHGGLVLAPGERARRPPLDRDERARLDAFRRWAQSDLVPRGARIEPKSSACTVHVRELASRVRGKSRAERVLAAGRARARSAGLAALVGRLVLEVGIDAGAKARALETLASRARARAIAFAGDDATDIEAIRYAERTGGVGLFVRSTERPRAPRGVSGSLSGVDDVHRLLTLLAAAL